MLAFMRVEIRCVKRSATDETVRFIGCDPVHREEMLRSFAHYLPLLHTITDATYLLA